MANGNPVNFNNVSIKNNDDKIRIIVAFLASLKVLLGSFGLNFFNDEQLQAIENIIPFLFIAWGIWKNNYISIKGKLQKKALDQRHLL